MMHFEMKKSAEDMIMEAGTWCGCAAEDTDGVGRRDAYTIFHQAQRPRPAQYVEGWQRACAGEGNGQELIKISCSPRQIRLVACSICTLLVRGLAYSYMVTTQARQAANYGSPSSSSVFGWWTTSSKNKMPWGLNTCKAYHIKKNQMTGFIEAEVHSKGLA